MKNVFSIVILGDPEEMKITTCLLDLLNQSRGNAFVSVSSLSAYGSSLIYSEKIVIII